jgi:hypothetical protein
VTSKYSCCLSSLATRHFFPAPGVGVEPTASWFRARRHYRQQLPRNRAHPPLALGEKGRVRASDGQRTSIPASSRHSSSSSLVTRHSSLLLAFRGEGVEPSSPGSRPGSLPLADPRESGRRGSRTLKAHRSAVFGTAAIACWLALPFVAAAAGIEPAIVSLTGSRLTIRPHRKKSGRWELNPRSPVPETGGLPGFPTS